MSERDTRIRRAKAKRDRGRVLPTRWHFPADGVSRVACPCPWYLAPRQDAPGIILSSVKLKSLKINPVPVGAVKRTPSRGSR